LATELGQWQEEEATGSTMPKPESRGGYLKGMKITFHPYKDDFLRWEEEGLDINAMVKSFEEKFGFSTAPRNVESHFEL